MEDDRSAGDSAQPRLHSVALSNSAYAAGRILAELGLEGVRVKAVRRIGEGKLASIMELRLESNDVVALLGVPQLLAAAEIHLPQG